MKGVRLLPWLLTALPARAMGGCGPSDLHKKSTGLITEMPGFDGAELKVDILCGEDGALAAARMATHRKHRAQDGEKVLKVAKRLEEVLQEEAVRGAVGYLVPDLLDHGLPTERPRQLKTGGLFSRRANQHQRDGQFKEAVADLVRALLRPKLDETARDKLMATLVDFLKKAASQAAKKAEDGDLSDLFEALEDEDSGDDNGKIDLTKIKRAYRDLSIKYHPDKNPGAKDRFNKIRDAYEILSDPVKTLLYDTGGIELVKKFEKESTELDRTESKDVKVTVDLKNVYSGHAIEQQRSRRIVCRSCRLQPNLPRCRRCKRCPGERKEKQRWIDSYRYTVDEYEEPSEDFCEEQKIPWSVSIEKGMMGGERIPFPYMGSQLPKKVPGDISVVLMIRPDPVFKRIGNDLLITVHVSLFEALLGFERQIRHLDGHLVNIKVDRGSVVRPGSGLDIAGEGMPLKEDSTSFGKLIVKFELDFPEEINGNKAGELENALRGLGLAPKQAGVLGKKRTEL